MGESSGAVPARPGSNLGVAPRDALGILSPSAISLRTAVCDRHHLQMRGRTSDGTAIVIPSAPKFPVYLDTAKPP